MYGCISVQEALIRVLCQPFLSQALQPELRFPLSTILIAKRIHLLPAQTFTVRE